MEFVRAVAFPAARAFARLSPVASCLCRRNASRAGTRVFVASQVFVMVLVVVLRSTRRRFVVRRHVLLTSTSLKRVVMRRRFAVLSRRLRCCVRRPMAVTLLLVFVARLARLTCIVCRRRVVCCPAGCAC